MPAKRKFPGLNGAGEFSKSGHQHPLLDNISIAPGQIDRLQDRTIWQALALFADDPDPIMQLHLSSTQSNMEMAGAQVKTGISIPLMAARRASASIHQNHSACCQPVGGPEVSVIHNCLVRPALLRIDQQPVERRQSEITIMVKPDDADKIVTAPKLRVTQTHDGIEHSGLVRPPGSYRWHARVPGGLNRLRPDFQDGFRSIDNHPADLSAE